MSHNLMDTLLIVIGGSIFVVWAMLLAIVIELYGIMDELQKLNAKPGEKPNG